MTRQHRDLIERYFSRDLSPAELETLERLILDDPQVREGFLSTGAMDGMMHEWGGAQSPESRLRTLGEVRQLLSRKQHLRTLTRCLALGAAAVLCLAAFFKFTRKPDQPGPPIADQPSTLNTTSAVASLRGGSLVTAGGAPVRQSLTPGEYRLIAETASLETIGGATVACMAPARFDLVDSREIQLREGVFMVSTPSADSPLRIKVQGTPLSLESGRCVIRVLSATAEILLESGKILRDSGKILTEVGAPVLLARDGTVNPSTQGGALRALAAVLRGSFNPPDTVAGLPESLLRDPSLAIYYDFESAVTRSNLVANRAVRAGSPRDGVIVGAMRNSDRWRSGSVIEFSHHTDRVRMPVTVETPQLTLAMRVCVVGLDRHYNSLFMCDDFLPGNIHWQIRNDGVIEFGCRVDHYEVISSPPVIGPVNYGEWMHLACTFNAATGEVAHYLDGKRIHSGRVPRISSIVIDNAELGNWRPAGLHDVEPEIIRNFMGKMDDFCLFTRILTDEEIRRLAK